MTLMIQPVNDREFELYAFTRPLAEAISRF